MQRDWEPGPILSACIPLHVPLRKRAQSADYKKSIDTTYVMVSFTWRIEMCVNLALNMSLHCSPSWESND